MQDGPVHNNMQFIILWDYNYWCINVLFILMLQLVKAQLIIIK